VVLRTILCLAATVSFAISKRVKPCLEVLDESGIGFLVQALQLVRIISEVVEFLFPVAVLDILAALRPNGAVDARASADEPLQEHRRAPRRGFSVVQERQERAPVSLEPLYTSKLGEGGSKVGVED
jgi:hypothetical protein